MTSESEAVQKARADLVAALSELEEAANFKARLAEFRASRPGAFFAAVGGAGVLLAGIVTLAIVSAVRRK